MTVSIEKITLYSLSDGSEHEAYITARRTEVLSDPPHILQTGIGSCRLAGGEKLVYIGEDVYESMTGEQYSLVKQTN